MLNKVLKKLLKKRIISSIVDLLLFIFLFTLSFTILLDARLVQNNWLLPFFLLFFFLYYSLIPKLTNGYTFSGFIMGIKVIKLDSTDIKLWEYFLRSLYALFAYMLFLGYIRVRTNTLGQFYFDKPFNVTVIGREQRNIFNDNKNIDITFYFLGE